jgi:hypothetical protein
MTPSPASRKALLAEAKALFKALFAEQRLRPGTLLTVLLSLASLLLVQPQSVILALVLFGLVLAVWVVLVIAFSKQKGALDPSEEYPVYPELTKRLPWIILAGGGLVAALVVLAWAAPQLLPPCPPQETGAFASQTSEGWLIRYEGERRLGETLAYEAVLCRADPVDTLAFDFQLGSEYGSAQVGLDGRGAGLIAGMGAWIYSEEDNPATLAVQCFVMEGEGQGWAWHESAPQALQPGRWQALDCPAEGFTPPGWANPPQFIGLLFSDTAGGQGLSRVNLADISIR